MPTSPATAKVIAESLLQRTGAAMMSGDFEDFAACFHMPMVIITEDRENVLESVADLELVFQNVRAAHRRSGVTEMARHPLAAVFSDPETIKSSHETRLLSGARLVEEPYPAISILKYIDENWVITQIEYAVPASAQFLNSALRSNTSFQPNSS